jgi:ADP-heptose:LPS heptosyltransferase
MKTLVYHTGALGDFITIIPVMSCWKKLYPSAAITLVGKPDFADLIRNQNLVDDVIDINSCTVIPLFNPDTTLQPGFKEKLEGYDSAILFADLKSPVFKHCRQLQIPDIRIQPPFPDNQIHIIDYHMQLLPEYALSNFMPIPYIMPDTPVFTKIPGISGGKYAVIHPGSGSQIKNWLFERFRQTASIINKKTGLQIVWVCGPAEADLKFDENDVVLRDIKLQDLIHILAKSSLYIGNDSGISHLAAAIGCKSIVLFGPSNPKVWAPKGRDVAIITNSTNCRACHNQTNKKCPFTRECLTKISVEKIVESISIFD